MRFIIHLRHQGTSALERERDAHCNQVGKNWDKVCEWSKRPIKEQQP